MVKKFCFFSAFIFLVIVGYLSFWPVNIEPQAWEAPPSEGYMGFFAPNMKLAGLNSLGIGENHGPEDVAARYEDGDMIAYTSTQSGDIIRINTSKNTHKTITNTGGVALGVQFDAQGNCDVPQIL